MATNKAASMETMQELHSLIVQTHINRLKKDIAEGFITDAATASAIAEGSSRYDWLPITRSVRA